MYPDMNPGTMWEIASKPGVSVRNRAATPEEVGIMERGKTGKPEDVKAAQQLQRQFMDELSDVGPDLDAPIQICMANVKQLKSNCGAAGLVVGLV